MVSAGSPTMVLGRHREMVTTTVQTHILQLDLPPEGFHLCSGQVLPQIEVAYESYGTLDPDGGNAVYVCHTLTSDAHAAGYHEGDETPGWWDDLIGPGKGLDTDRFFVVCSNFIGGCKGSTGPLTVNPETGERYGLDFPVIEMRDVVRVQKLLLEQLGVERLYAVIGGSLGGMCALQWALDFPDFVDRCICIAAGAHLSPQALAFDVIARHAIEDDPDFQAGRYYEKAAQPEKGLARARQIGHITYLSSQSMALKFGRSIRPEPIPGQDSKFSHNFEVESYLDYQGRKFVDRFDANSYLHMMRVLDNFDLESQFGDLETAFAKVRGKFLVVSISSDWLFPPSQQLELLGALLANRRDVSYFSIDSPYGHDAFLIEYETLSRGVKAFLEGALPATPPADIARMDEAIVSDMIDSDQRLLDVGSGDGDMMVALALDKGIHGVCLDRDFAMVVECMAKGLPAIHLDADKALSCIPDHGFDCVLLNQTLQQLHSALQTIKHVLRIAPAGVIGFPNIAYFAYRLKLALFGRLPKSRTLPYEWYDTPNIHVITCADFRDLCERHGFTVEEIHYLADSALGRALIGVGLHDLGADRVVLRLGRGDTAVEAQ